MRPYIPFAGARAIITRMPRDKEFTEITSRIVQLLCQDAVTGTLGREVAGLRLRVDAF